MSVVKYLNTAPLVWGLERGPLKGRYRLSYTVPAGCAEALRSGAADVLLTGKGTADPGPMRQTLALAERLAEARG
ncbi:MAG: hypothetical protein L0212_13110 [Acidobacteria bacterium]|nr:hypothetical protein [Acidobacteriota bacterium]